MEHTVIPVPKNAKVDNPSVISNHYNEFVMTREQMDSILSQLNTLEKIIQDNQEIIKELKNEKAIINGNDYY